MAESLKKITVNVPAGVLERARSITQRGITETIIEGLLALERGQKRGALRALRGRVHIDLDLERTRR
jgi:hypothetical protein